MGFTLRFGFRHLLPPFPPSRSLVQAARVLVFASLLREPCSLLFSFFRAWRRSFLSFVVTIRAQIRETRLVSRYSSTMRRVQFLQIARCKSRPSRTRPLTPSQSSVNSL